MKEIKLPLFLLAEEPTAPVDRFTFIYSPLYLSLILIIPENDISFLPNFNNINKPRKTFIYREESFEFIIIQNNVLATGGELAPVITEEEFLNKAWKWYEEYLIWEDNNLEEGATSQLN